MGARVDRYRRLNRAKRSYGTYRRRAIVAGVRAYARLPYDISRTIVVTGSPRSGTTWLAGLLNTIPRSAVLFEPLNLGRVPEARAAGFGWRTEVAPGTGWPSGERFIERALTGRILNDWTTRDIDHLRRPRTWIVKFVRANRMLGWIVERFPVRRPILLIRHPCAVVASQFAQGWRRSRDEILSDLGTRHPAWSEIVGSLGRPEELAAADWAIDALIPLASPAPRPFEVLFYERLVRDLVAEIRPVFGAWRLPVPDELARRAGLWSRTTAEDTKASAPVDRLEAWRSDLGPRQVATILEVTRSFGLDLYGEGPEPDLESFARLDAGSGGS